MNARARGAALNGMPYGVRASVFAVLVLVLVMFGTDVWAQTEASFPFLSPDETQAKMLFNAFAAQFQIFGIGSDADISAALRYLAMLATLIGGIMILAFPKFQNLTTVFTWLLLVVIVLMRPVGSQLLFAPVGQNTGAPIGAVQQYMAVGQNASCKDSGVTCGFTPQLAVIHATSVVQRILQDVFNSRQWVGLVERMKAESTVQKTADFHISKPLYDEWKLLRDAGEKTCQSTPLSLAKSFYAEGNGAAGGGAPTTRSSNNDNKGKKLFTFDEVFQKIGSSYQFDQNGQFINSNKPPPIIVFPETEPQEWKGSKLSIDYEKALTLLYRTYAPGANPQAVVAFSPSSNSDAVTVETVLDALQAGGFFKVFADATQPGSLGPGFFMTRENKQKLNFDEGSSGYASAIAGTFSSSDARRCYVSEKLNNTFNEVSPCERSGSAYNDGTESLLNPVNHAVFYKRIREITDNNSLDPKSISWDMTLESWRKFIEVYRDIRNMPVLASDIDLSGGTITQYAKVDVSKPEATENSCDTKESRLAKNILEIFGQDGTGKQRDARYEGFLNFVKSGNLPKANEMLPDKIISNGAQDYIGEERVLALASISRDILIKIEKDGVPESERKVVFLSEIFARILNGSGQSLEPANQNLAQSLDTSLRVSKNITTPLGWFASYVAEALIIFSSWFVGPAAQAYIELLPKFLNLVLMVIIVCTPILFMLALVMPGAAMGVLTVSVLGIAVLKVVPITFLIVNSIGGMVYEITSYVNPDDAWVTQGMLIWAMGGIYTSLVGLTLYLMFKLGDPSALIGRFGALDGAAKEAAAAGLKATYAALGVAGAATGGALLAAAKAGSMKAGAKFALDKARQKGLAAVDAVTDGAASQAAAAEEVTKPEPRQTPSAAEFEKMDAFDRARALGMNEQEYNQYLMDARADGYAASEPDKDGNIIRFEMDQEGKNLASITKIDGNDKILNTFLDNQISAGLGAMRPTSAAVNSGDKSMVTDAQEAVDEEKTKNATMPDAANPGTPADTPSPPAGESGTPVGQAAGTGGPGGPVAAGAAMPVQVVGGKLDEITSLPTEVSSVQAQAEALERQRNASELLAAKELRERAKNPDQIKALDGAIAAIEANDKSTFNEKMKEAAKASGVKDSSVATASELIAFEKNKLFDTQAQLNTMINDAKREAEAAKVSGKDEHMKYWSEQVAKLEQEDPIAWAMGEHQVKLAEYGERWKMQKLEQDIKNVPTAWQSAQSALWGSTIGAAGSGSLSSIPVIGGIIKEALNEGKQAPERARAIKAAGGFFAWRKLHGDAERMGHFQKEIAPIAAGTQYQAMVNLGTFDGTVRLAQQAAVEAVARTRSQIEALDWRLARMEQSKSPTDAGSVTFANAKFMNTNQMYGLDAADSMAKVNSVYVNALDNREGMFKVERSKEYVKRTQTDGTSKLEETATSEAKGKQNMVRKNIAVMSDISAGLAAKQFASALDEQMVKHYGIFEKRFFRPKGEWYKTGNIESDEALKTFTRIDPDTDYIVGGHLKMVQGKADFFGMRGKYVAYNQLRQQQNFDIADYIEKNMKDGKLGDITIAMKDSKIDMVAPGMDKAISKAVEGLGGKANMKLEGIFEEAFEVGKSAIMIKSMRASSVIAAEAENLTDEVAKASQAALDATAKLSTNLTKKMTVNHNRKGVNIETDTFAKELFYKVSSFKGMDARLANQILTNTFKEIGGMNEDKRRTLTKAHKKLDGDILDISHQVSQDFLNILADNARKFNESLADSILTSKDFGRKLNDGMIEFKGVSLNAKTTEYNDTSSLK